MPHSVLLLLIIIINNNNNNRRYSFDDANDHCRRLGNLTKPTILNRDMDCAFQRYLKRDPNNVLPDSYVWLGAQSRPVADKNTTKWQWLDGVSTGKYRTCS